jgi:general stress protein CsbA
MITNVIFKILVFKSISINLKMYIFITNLYYILLMRLLLLFSSHSYLYMSHCYIILVRCFALKIGSKRRTGPSIRKRSER